MIDQLVERGLTLVASPRRGHAHLIETPGWTMCGLSLTTTTLAEIPGIERRRLCRRCERRVEWKISP